MTYQIVFSDVDGTLLNSDHRMLPGTLRSIRALQARGIPFVIISGRSPSGIYPILEENGFSCPIICYSGALMLDEQRRVVFSEGFDLDTARRVIQRAETLPYECVWNLFSLDRWIVRDAAHPRVELEARIVRARAEAGGPDSLPSDAVIGKIMCMCRANEISRIEEEMKAAFPALSIARSSDTLLEIMRGGISKSSAVKKVCEAWDIPLKNAVAFGDQFNDADMLKTAGIPFLMGNAPAELKRLFPRITDSNDNEGIEHALNNLGLNTKKEETA